MTAQRWRCTAEFVVHEESAPLVGSSPYHLGDRRGGIGNPTILTVRPDDDRQPVEPMPDELGIEFAGIQIDSGRLDRLTAYPGWVADTAVWVSVQPDGRIAVYEEPHPGSDHHKITEVRP